MHTSTYRCGNTLDEVWADLKLDPEVAQRRVVNPLLLEGYSPLAICYAAGRSCDKLTKFIGDTRIYSVLVNEVRKHAFKRDDKRWG